MSDPILHNLRQVPDETLFVRLALLRRRIPTDYFAEDYAYRRGVWESANNAVRAEIRRRKAPPPPWWSVAEAPDTQPRRPHTGQIAGSLVAGVSAVVLFGIPALPIALVLTVAVAGGGWLIAEIVKNQRL